MLILIAASSATLRRRIRNALRRVHFDAFVEAASGTQALCVLKERDVGLVIVHDDVGGMAGTELATTMRRLPAHEDTPVVLLSPRGTYEDVLDALEGGVSQYIIEPYEDESLARKIRNMVDRMARQHPESGEPGKSYTHHRLASQVDPDVRS